MVGCYAEWQHRLPSFSIILPVGIQIHHGQSVALPVITTAATAWHGMFVSKQTADGRPVNQKQQVSNHNLQRNRLSFLHIQLEGQQGSCGPLLLETLVTTRFEVCAVHRWHHPVHMAYYKAFLSRLGRCTPAPAVLDFTFDCC